MQAITYPTFQRLLQTCSGAQLLKNTMKPSVLHKSDALVAFLVVMYILVLAAVPSLLSAQQVKFLFSEEGPFEQLSIVTWIFAALLIPLAIRPPGKTAWLFSALFLCFAAREADWHKEFTADSLLKANYYRYTDAPADEKIIAAVFALAFIALVVYAGFVIVRFLLRGGWRSRAGLWLLLGTALIVLGKVLDRAPAELAEAGYAIGAWAGPYTAVFEEGLEMIHPLILAWSVWLCRFGPSYLSLQDVPTTALFIHR